MYRLICKGTIEERILQRAREKSKIQKIVISGGSFKPDTLKPTEVVSLLLDDEEIERKCKLIQCCYAIRIQSLEMEYKWPVLHTDRQRQAERKQQEVEREAERKRKYMGSSSSGVIFLYNTWLRYQGLTCYLPLVGSRREACLSGFSNTHRIHASS